MEKLFIQSKGNRSLMDFLSSKYELVGVLESEHNPEALAEGTQRGILIFTNESMPIGDYEVYQTNTPNGMTSMGVFHALENNARTTRQLRLTHSRIYWQV